MRTIKVDGFHGTELKNAINILKDGFTSKTRLDHWLGQGIYFYADYDLALWWIKTKAKHYKKTVDECAVIYALMECEDKFWLDLDTSKGIDYFFSELETILTSTSHHKSLKFDFSQMKDNEIRIRYFCFALDLLKIFCDIKLVAMTFQKDRPRYAKYSIRDFENRFFPLPLDLTYQERQICSTSNDIILSKQQVFPKKATF